VLHPALGFMALLSSNVWFAFYSGAFANWAFTSGLSPMLTVIGSVLNSPEITNIGTLLSQPMIVTVGGIAFIVVTAAIAIVSRRWTAALNTILATAGVLTLAVAMFVFLTSSNEAFRAALNSYSSKYTSDSNYYNTVLQAAQSNGLASGFSWSDTLMMVPFGAFVFAFLVNFQAVGGELKNAPRTSYVGCLISILLAGVIGVGAVAAYQGVVTGDFSNAVNLGYYTGNYALPVPPTLNFFASLLTSNVVVLVLINSGLVFTSVALLFNYYLFVSRQLLSTAFDRLTPTKLADVSERFHTPHVAILFCMVIAAILLPLFTYFGSVFIAISAVFGEMAFGMLVWAIACILFPYLKRTKDMYQSSPVRRSVGGVPLITLVGLWNLIALGALSYLYFVDPAYGTNSPLSLASVTLVAAAGPIWYFARRAYLKSKGIELDFAFRQLPPE
jgi:APA family basic amino acid/polyamine antiporter